MIKNKLIIGGEATLMSKTLSIGQRLRLIDYLKSISKDSKVAIFYDIQDLSSMYQDAAATIPALVDTAVGFVRNKLRDSHHAVQATAASRPILRSSNNYFLNTDGIDDFLQSSTTVDMTHTNAISMICKIRMTDNNKLGYPIIFGDYTSVNGVVHLRAPQATGSLKIGFVSKGTSLASTDVAIQSLSTDAVISALSTTNNLINLNINGITVQSVGNQGAINYGNHILHLGRRQGLYDSFAGRIYQFFMIDRLLTEQERQQIEKLIS